MEIILSILPNTQILVTCNQQSSHTFDPHLRIPNYGQEIVPPKNAVAYGKALYQALFPEESLARQTLEERPVRLVLIATSHELEAVPWEYLYGPEDFLVLQCHFLRGIAAEQRIAPPELDCDLHIVAIPSHPLSSAVSQLDIEGEWQRLKEIINKVPFTCTLDRVRPPTLEQMRGLLISQQHCVVHFMGHGGLSEAGAVLLFEKENVSEKEIGNLDQVTAAQFAMRVRGTVFLVTLNACESATPQPTQFGNLAASLVRQRVPYALGMRFSIVDEDAKTFSRLFYSDLAQGVPVEEALLQARLELARSSRRWAIGVPVLYTALTTQAPGFMSTRGKSSIDEHEPLLMVHALPRAEGVFQGRLREMQLLGAALTGDQRPRIVTLHGGGGVGKTALAREAVERFAYAWPGGVWAISLENLPTRNLFVSDLARLLKLEIQNTFDPQEIEQQVQKRLTRQRTLIVLDNAETLIEAIEQNDQAAIRLAHYIRQLPGPSVSLLITSRRLTGWSGEQSHELKGLSPKEGASLFQQSIPQQMSAKDLLLAEALSIQVEGHPLSIHLLSGAFGVYNKSLQDFISEYEQQLIDAKDKYVGTEHRQYKLYASLEMSTRALDTPLRSLLSGVWIFHATFLAESAARIFDPNHKNTSANLSTVFVALDALWQRGLLMREIIPDGDKMLLFYRLHPTSRPYVEHQLKQVYAREMLLQRFSTEYTRLLEIVSVILDKGSTAPVVVERCLKDIERAIKLVNGVQQAFYLMHWGRILYRLGDQHWSEVLENALNIAQGRDEKLVQDIQNVRAIIYIETGQLREAEALLALVLSGKPQPSDHASRVALLYNVAQLYRLKGQTQQALDYLQRALMLYQEIALLDAESLTMKAKILSMQADLYKLSGQTEQAIDAFEQTLALFRESGDRVSESATLTHLANLYHIIGQLQLALRHLQQALLISREIKDSLGEISALSNLAAIYFSTRQYQQALRFAQQALSISQKTNDQRGEAVALDHIAKCYQEMKEYHEARRYYEQAFNVAHKTKNPQIEATILTNMGSLFLSQNTYPQALDFFQQALALLQQIGDRNGEAYILNNIGNVYQNMGQLTQALDYYQQARIALHEIYDQATEARVLNNIATIYRDTQHFQEAIDSFQQALSIIQRIGLQADEGRILMNLAALYQTTKQFEQALSLFRQAAYFYDLLNDISEMALAQGNIGGIYVQMGQSQQALEAYRKALSLFRDAKNGALEATTMGNLAAVYEKIGDLQEAFGLYQRASSIRYELGDRAGETEFLLLMARILEDTEQLTSANLCYTRAFQSLGDIDNPQKVAIFQYKLASWFERTGNIQQAQDLYEQAITLLQNQGKDLAVARVQHDLAKLLMSHGYLHEALGLFKQALEIKKRFGEMEDFAVTQYTTVLLLMQLGYTEWALEASQQALQILQQANGQKEHLAAAQYARAQLLTDLERRQEAKKLFEESLRLSQDNKNTTNTIKIEFSKLLFQLGEHQRSISMAWDAYMYFYQVFSGKVPGEIEESLKNLKGMAAPGQFDTLWKKLIARPQPAWLRNVKESSLVSQTLLPQKEVARIVARTVEVLTRKIGEKAEWRERVVSMLQVVQRHYQVQEVEFLTAILALLDGETPDIWEENIFAKAIKWIEENQTPT